MSLEVFIDGATRHNETPSLRRSACAAVVTFNEEIIFQLARAIPPCSNNVAEYNALLLSLEILVSNGKYEYPKIYSDSAIVVNQVNKKWRCTSPDLLPFLFSVRIIQANYPFQLFQVPRRIVWLPDRLCNTFLDSTESLTFSNLDDSVESILQ